MDKQAFFEIGMTTLLSLNLAAAYVTAFIWGSTSDTQLFVHLGVVFAASLLFGATLADTRKALLYAIGSIIVGLALAVAMISIPALILAESVELVDTTVTVAVIAVTRLFIIGITFLFLGVIIGSFVGDAIVGQTEIQT